MLVVDVGVVVWLCVHPGISLRHYKVLGCNVLVVVFIGVGSWYG